MPRLVYLSALGLLLVTGAFLLTYHLVTPPQNLEARCHRMYTLQLRVHDGLKAIATGNAGTVRDAVALADQQARIVAEADRAIELLEADGSVAFHEVFIELRKDMQQVQRRLAAGNVGKATQVIEQDVLDTLWEVVRPFRKVRTESVW